jgi:hypothetical protein
MHFPSTFSSSITLEFLEYIQYSEFGHDSLTASPQSGVIEQFPPLKIIKIKNKNKK